MKKLVKRHPEQINHKTGFPLSGAILLILMLSTFLTVLVAEQQQENRSKAQTNPIQQACLPTTNLTDPEASKLEPFCNQFPDAAICKDFCKRTGDAGGNSKSALCQPGGVYHCEAAAGAPEKGKCQQGACATTPRIGTDSFCGGGGTCCEPPHPLGGTCGKPADCVAGLVCTNNICSNPPPPPGPLQDLDGDGKQNDLDDDIDGDGIPNATDPDADGDGQVNEQDQQPNGAPGAVPPPPAAPAPNAPGGGGAPPGGGTTPRNTCSGQCAAAGTTCTSGRGPGTCTGGKVCCKAGPSCKRSGTCMNSNECCGGYMCNHTGGMSAGQCQRRPANCAVMSPTGKCSKCNAGYWADAVGVCQSNNAQIL